MAMLILTIVMEVLSLASLFVTARYRKRKKLKWVLGAVTGITQATFWCLAIRYLTGFIVLEVGLEITAIVLLLAVLSKNKKKQASLAKICSTPIMVTATIFLFCMVTYNFFGFRWTEGSMEKTLSPITEQFTPPENLKELNPQFCCVHDAKEEKYRLYWAWNGGICEFASYTENGCTVYRLPDSRQDLPKLETETKHFLKYNYNFEMYEEPTLVDEKTEETYNLYVCESSYKEDYTK